MELHDPRHDLAFRHELEGMLALLLFTALAMIVAIAILIAL